MRILKNFFLPLGILTLGLIGFEGTSFLYHSNFVEAQTITTLPISLPEFVKVKLLKSKGIISGIHLVDINTKTKKIKFEQGEKLINQDIAKIESLEFSGRVKLKGGRIVMRGGGNSGSNCSNSESWKLPLNALKLKDSSQAELTLSSLPKDTQTEIEQIKDVRTYVVDEMKFESQGKVNLKITPCSE